MPKITAQHAQHHFSDDVMALNPDLMRYFKGDAERVSDGTIAPPQPVEPPRPRMNKYGARKAQVGELIFDSQKEARRYLVLKDEENRGVISNLRTQVEFVLLAGFVYQGKKVEAVRYTADFVYHRDGKIYIEDTKSEATARSEAFRIRWRLLQWMHVDATNVVLLLS